MQEDGEDDEDRPLTAAELFLQDTLPAWGQRALDPSDTESLISALKDSDGDFSDEGSEDEDDPFDWATFNWDIFREEFFFGTQLERDAAAGTYILTPNKTSADNRQWS